MPRIRVLFCSKYDTSGITKSTPGIFSLGKVIPASITIISLPNSSAVIFLPISPTPPKNLTFNDFLFSFFSVAGLSAFTAFCKVALLLPLFFSLIFKFFVSYIASLPLLNNNYTLFLQKSKQYLKTVINNLSFLGLKRLKNFVGKSIIVLNILLWGRLNYFFTPLLKV